MGLFIMWTVNSEHSIWWVFLPRFHLQQFWDLQTSKVIEWINQSINAQYWTVYIIQQHDWILKGWCLFSIPTKLNLSLDKPISSTIQTSSSSSSLSSRWKADKSFIFPAKVEALRLHVSFRKLAFLGTQASWWVIWRGLILRKLIWFFLTLKLRKRSERSLIASWN